MPYNTNNDHTVPSCMYDTQDFSDIFAESSTSPWTRRDRVSLTDADYSMEEDDDDNEKYPLKEKNPKNTHVPHRDKPAQAVAKRNARERRRVHAVNMAFVRLRKMIPIQNTRGKRVSKVKTLQNAIRYIKELEIILEEQEKYNNVYNEAKCFLYHYEDFWCDFNMKTI